jgi:photosystem II stability/assembly factor-like uncharacterized protein
LDAFFTTAQEGWVSGGTDETHGGIILHTTDGGDHWEVQYGDPQSSDRAVRNIRFLDGARGWAMQGTGSAARLLHTMDGHNWNLAGTIPENSVDFMFVSDAIGVAIGSSHIVRTTNGGQSWQNTGECRASVQVQGLARNVTCDWVRLQFITPSVAYAVGFNRQARTVVFLARTSDGGASWSITTAMVTDIPQDAFFLDENTGYIRTGAPDTGQIFKTTDGGNTWMGLAASPGARIQFADPEVGWAVLYNKVSFTTDSGNHWNSRQYAFPARVNAFSLPRRDRGYVVGEHGMIFRYRIVPESYSATGMIPAPLLSGIDSPLDKQVDQLAQQVQKLAQDAGLPAASFTQNTAMGNAAGAGTGATVTPGAAAGTGGFSQNAAGSAAAGGGAPALAQGIPSAAAGGCIAAPTGQAGATPPSAPAASGGFTQDTGACAASAAPAPSAAGGGGFVQDTGTATATFNQVSTSAPQFVSQYRNLNLLMAGVQMSTQIPATVACLKQSFESLKTIKSPQAAIAVISGLQANVMGLRQMVRNAFQFPK